MYLLAAVSTPTNDQLVELLARVRDDDEAAFSELHSATRGRVEHVVQRVLRATEHTVEVVQDVYLHVWQHAATFDPGRASVLGWLTMLAHRRAVDRVRQVARSRARDERDAAMRVPVVADVPELGIALMEAARVRAALRQLSPRQCDAVVLTFLHGHTQTQAARLLAIPEGTLKTRVRDGLSKLRLHLGAAAA